MHTPKKKPSRTNGRKQKRAPLSERFSENAIRSDGTNMRQREIVNVSLEILKEKGLSELSLREIAKRMDMQAPALYWHFKNKEMLVDYMAEAILKKEFENLKPRDEKEPWQTWLVKTMLRLRTAMLAYPDGGRVVAGAHLDLAVTLLQLFEFAIESLVTAHVPGEKALSITQTAIHYTFGCVIEEQSSPTPQQAARFNPGVFLASYPYFKKAMIAHSKKRGVRNKDFLMGLQYIIRGSEK